MNEDLAYYSHLKELGSNIMDSSSVRGFDAWYSSILPSDKNAAILDYGCGFGDFVEYLKLKGFENISGVDINPVLVSAAAERTGCRFEVLKDIREFSEGNLSKYDCIHLKDVLEHIDKRELVFHLGKLKRMLRPGGFIIVSVPQMSGFTSLFTMFNDFTHNTLFTERSLKYILRAAGFSSVELVSPREPFRLKPSALLLRLARIFWFKIICIIYFIERPGEEMPPYIGDRILVKGA